MSEHDEIDRLDLIAESKQTSRSARRLPQLILRSARLVSSAGRRDALWALLLQLTPALMAGVQVLLARDAVQALINAERDDQTAYDTARPVVLLVLVGAFTAACGLASGFHQRILSELVSRRVWQQILGVTTAVKLDAYEDPQFFDQLRRVELNAVEKPAQIAQALITSVGGLVGTAGVMIALVALQPLLLPLLLLAGLPLAYFSRRGAKTEFDFVVDQTPIHRERLAMQGLLTEREPAKEVRAFDSAEMLSDRWASRYDIYILALRRQVLRRIGLALTGSFLSFLIAAVAGGIMVAYIVTGRMSAATASAAAVAGLQLGRRAGQLVRGSSSIYESALFLQDLEDFLSRSDPETTDEDVRARSPSDPSQPFGRLRVEGLSFAYPTSRNVTLRDIDLDIEAGELVALVGENGSGKTTLAKLLALLYEPTSGRVIWDGHEVEAADHAALRRHIAVVFQDFLQYPLPASENIGIGRPSRRDDTEAVRRAAVQAGADAFLTRLPRGYDTYLSKMFKGGRDLSVGQWQRVALARAYFRDAPFVILDEPTSALDPKAEYELFESIRLLLADRTVVLISHRFSSVRGADRIVVLDEGRIVEEGDHAQLMAAHGLYAEMFDLQASAYTAEVTGTRSANRRARAAQPDVSDGTAAPTGP